MSKVLLLMDSCSSPILFPFSFPVGDHRLFICLYNRENAADVKAKFIIEAANHPTDPEADEVIIHLHFTKLYRH